MLRIWISKNSAAKKTGNSVRFFRWVFFLGAALLAACAGPEQTKVATTPSIAPYYATVLPTVSNEPAAVLDSGFLASEIASGAAEYIQLGRESLSDSAWFDASEYFDSAMVHLSALEANDSLSLDVRSAARVYQDSVREWLVQSVTQASRLGEADDLSDLLNQEIQEVPDSALKNLEESLKALPDQAFDLPLPSPVPQPVLQALRVFTGPGRGYFTRWLQRRNRYDSLISERLLERSMPRDLLYLSMIESGFNSNAWSHASASGLWQFISGTGRRYGLHNDWYEDPRRDPVRATDAALDYLEDLYAEFNNWDLAMASYNCGEGRIRKKLDHNPNQSYWDMNLPVETRFYVPKIMAAMIIGHNPAFFGFNPKEDIEPRLRFDTVTVGKCLALRSIAKIMDMSEDSLRDLNPALRRACTPPGRKSFVLYVPEGSAQTFYSNYDRMETAAATAWRRHVVGRKETLAGIAVQYGVSMESLQEANHLKKTQVRRGQIIVVPVSAPVRGGGGVTPPRIATASRYKVKKGETIYDIARRFQVSIYALREANGLSRSSKLRAGKVLSIPVKSPSTDLEADSAPKVVKASRHKVHVVRKGETLASIARKVGVKPDELKTWNGLRSDAVITGQKLVYHPSGTVMDALKKTN